MTSREWEPICDLAALEVERGATALVHGQAVAIFRTHDNEVFALGNYDPFAKASVLARGIVGTRGEIPFVASPMHKHAFDLRTGRCLDDDHVQVPSYDVRVVAGVVQVGPRLEVA
ncbi:MULTISPECIES: nitrite reductase small subunit NirD [unclassified Nocardioides]|uniref:nitrite reductase small subunit NirD n=1 Tax=unclassified Nocardioides TaxID=2615069 RepID=UPI000701562F|nr:MULTISPECIES: nitrite reductase small subunit NirD [unclassified Nocardioides]KQY55392.1 nitrite reductase small subunit [Nocardioides sp. Root140]KQZ75500.1 nitrite reductase small subunit [Nocardioides sp. Root151]KRF14576.1 nitrite reductase small subunit [Nocardioides sp. Soil796]